MLRRRKPRRTISKKTKTAEIRKELLERQLAEPVFVKQREYERALDGTLKKYDRGLNELDKVKKVLAKAASAGSSRDAKELSLAIEKIDDSIVAFGWDQLPYQYRNKKRMMIWPAADRKTKR